MREINDGKNYINVFGNISEFTDYLKIKPHKSGRDNSSQEQGNRYFYGTDTYDEAINLIKYGDDNLFNKVNSEIKKMNINGILGNVRNRNVYFNSVSGFLPNVPNMMVGSPLTMIDIKKEGLSQKIVNIFLNVRVASHVDGDEVVKIGIKYLNVIDLLEKKGYRCNLYSGCANTEYGNNYHSCLMVRIKTDREPLNLKKICFAIANPAMQRRLKFKWMEVNDFSYDFTNGYGQIEDNNYIKKLLKDKLKEDFVIWDYEKDNKAKDIKDIVKDLEKYGINVEL